MKKTCLYRIRAVSIFLQSAIALLACCSAQAGQKFHLADGDRVALIGNTFIERDRHYGQLESMLRGRFPGLRFSVRNMAWPGDTTTVQLRPLNFGSLEDHLARYQPTVCLVSYGANEAFEGPAGLSDYLSGYAKILDLLDKLAARVVMISPIPQENLGPPLPDPAAHNRALAEYVAATRKLADQRGIPFVDLFHSLESRTGGPNLTENGVHLSDYGYWHVAQLIADQLDLPPIRWNVTIDAAQNTAQADGAIIRELMASPQAVSFQAIDEALPVPAPPSIPEAASASPSAHTLAIQGLAPGRYTLLIDDAPVASHTAQQWAQGVSFNLAPSAPSASGSVAAQSAPGPAKPGEEARRPSEESSLRDLIVWKDLLFFNRWRAHNGEYIYGRRSQAGGGNAGNPSFPGEMAEFDRLLAEADDRLAELSKPRPRPYRLIAD
jgi:lysophospholipase L1-like esterase